MGHTQDMGLRTVFVDHRATSRRLRKAKLVVVEGADKGREFLLEKAKVFVGRSAVNDIQLSDKSISATHLELRAEEQGYLLRDLGSTNGTTLHGCRVRELYLNPEVPFKVGSSTLTLLPTDHEVEIPLSEEEVFQGVIGRSLSMREVFATLHKVAPTELTVLIEGDTGTGKERVARAVHDASRRKHKPYVVLDCSAIPKDLMESYVFGHEKGAFTGAVAQRAGAFEEAQGGTLFLDEIGELDLSLQPKLLRVLENRELKRVGSHQTLRADVRVVAATNRDLRAMVNEGTFREDLYFRLSIINLQLPSLVQRRDDIPLLVEHFLGEAAKWRADGARPRLTAAALDALMAYGWPGNVRELRNVILRASSLAEGAVVDRPQLLLREPLAPPAPEAKPPQPPASSAPQSPARSPQHEPPEVDLSLGFKEAKQEAVDRFEASYLRALMTRHEGNISQASRAAGLTRYHLRELLKRHDLG